MLRFICRALLLLAAAAPLAAQSAPAPDKSAEAPIVRLSGYAQVRETYQTDIGLTASINRARLAAGGAVAPGLTWRIQGEFRTGSAGAGSATVSLQDAYVRYAPRGPWALEAGQFKTPFTREFTTSLTVVETADRSTVVDSLAPKRDIGLMGEYTMHRIATLYTGVFNGEGQNVTANRDSTVLGVARLVVRPIAGVSLGANLARYFGDSTRYGADANYEAHGFVARGEYVAGSRDGIDAPVDEGWYALAGYFLIPSVQLVGKYEWFTRDAVSPQRKNRAWTAAVNAYPWSRRTRCVLEYISRKIGAPGIRRGEVLAQFQVTF
ncbi:MAG TPA: porin [Gemmatimonadales bacterium]|nr:porin [Gemmatimonadales bacterium]